MIVGIFCIKDINAGDEVTVDYGENYSVAGVPQICFCFTEKCKFFIGKEPEKNVLAKFKREVISRKGL